MADPITIGAYAALALGMAGEAALKGAVGEAVKDAWKALKSKAAVWAAGDVEALETNPDSRARQMVVAEAIDARPDDEKEVLRQLAQRLVVALKEAPPTGLDVGRLEALNVELGSITVTQGVGVRIGEAHVDGTFKTDPIKVGNGPGKR